MSMSMTYWVLIMNQGTLFVVSFCNLSTDVSRMDTSAYCLMVVLQAALFLVSCLLMREAGREAWRQQQQNRSGRKDAKIYNDDDDDDETEIIGDGEPRIVYSVGDDDCNTVELLDEDEALWEKNTDDESGYYIAIET